MVMSADSMGSWRRSGSILVFGALFIAVVIWYWNRKDETVVALSVLLTACYFMVMLLMAGFCFFVPLLFSTVVGFSLRQEVRLILHTRRSHVGNLADVIDFGVICFSLISCVMYVVETYFPVLANVEAWLLAELVMSVIFVFDSFMRLAIAVDRVLYLFSTVGIINVVTALPVIVFCVDKLSKGVDEAEQGIKLTFLRLIRLARLLRILRALHITQANPNQPSLYRELFSLAFTVLCMIFSAAGVYQWLENEDACFDTSIQNTLSFDGYKDPGVLAEHGCIHFHLAMYWCTIETLGRPRLIMEKDTTMIMLIVLVALSVLIIPRQLTNVISVLQQTNKYQRMEYTPSERNVKHLVVVGHREFAALNMFLYEFFHPQRGQHKVKDVVLLFPVPPHRDIEWLLAHPSYIGNVTYLQGTPLQEKDLDRASLATAAGVVVLANKDAENPRWHDGELLTCIQSMKAYWLKDIVQAQRRRFFHSSREAATNVLRPRIVAQVLLPETKDYLVELPGWTERDCVVVCSEYVAWMLGMATLSRGMATLVFNLTSHQEAQRFFRTRWYPRYEAGATQEIYSVRVQSKNVFVGMTLRAAAKLLAENHCILVAVERSEDDTGLCLYPGPSDLFLQAEDRLFCISQSYPQLSSTVASFSADGSGTKSESSSSAPSPFSPQRAPRGFQSSRSLRSGTDMMIRKITTNLDRVRRRNKSNEEQDLNRSESFAHVGPEADEDLYGVSSHKLPKGCEDVWRVSAEAPDGDPRRGSSSRRRSLRQGAPAVKPNREEILACLRSRDPEWSGHIVVLGLPSTQAGRSGCRGLVTELINTLARASDLAVSEQPFVGVYVIDEGAESRILDLCMIEPAMADVALQGSLRAVSSDPRNRESLVWEARITSARSILALPESIHQSAPRNLSTVELQGGVGGQKMIKQIQDTATVLTMQVARGCAERGRAMGAREAVHHEAHAAQAGMAMRRWRNKLHCVTLLLQESTTNLFFGHANMRHAGAAVSCDSRFADISPLNNSPLFASGELLAMTCFDRFVAEALFTPQVVPMLRLLVFGDQMGHQLFQASCPSEYAGCRYEEAFRSLLFRGIMLVGLLRYPVQGSSVFVGEDTFSDLPDLPMPYVITNPTPGMIVLQGSDLLFMIGDRQKLEREPQADGGQDGLTLPIESRIPSTIGQGETTPSPDEPNQPATDAEEAIFAENRGSCFRARSPESL